VNATVHPIGTRRNTHTEATASVRERGNSRAHVRGSALKRPWQSPHGVHVKIHTTVKECLLAVAHPTQHTHAFCGLHRNRRSEDGLAHSRDQQHRGRMSWGAPPRRLGLPHTRDTHVFAGVGRVERRQANELPEKGFWFWFLPKLATFRNGDRSFESFDRSLQSAILLIKPPSSWRGHQPKESHCTRHIN
jgi:hypothetical protein